MTAAEGSCRCWLLPPFSRSALSGGRSRFVRLLKVARRNLLCGGELVIARLLALAAVEERSFLPAGVYPGSPEGGGEKMPRKEKRLGGWSGPLQVQRFCARNWL